MTPTFEDKSPVDFEFEEKMRRMRESQQSRGAVESAPVSDEVVSRPGESVDRSDMERDSVVAKKIEELEQKVNRLTAVIAELSVKAEDPLMAAKLREVVREENRLDLVKLVADCKEDVGKYSKDVTAMLVKQAETLDVYLKILENSGLDGKVVEDIRKDIDELNLDRETLENIREKVFTYIKTMGNPVVESEFIPWNSSKGSAPSEYMKLLKSLRRADRPESAIREFMALSDTEKEAFKKADPETYHDMERLVNAMNLSFNRDKALFQIIGNGLYITEAFDIRERAENNKVRPVEEPRIENPVITPTAPEVVVDPKEVKKRETKGPKNKPEDGVKKPKVSRKPVLPPTAEEGSEDAPAVKPEPAVPAPETVPVLEHDKKITEVAEKSESAEERMNKQREELLAEGCVQFPGTEFYAKITAKISEAGNHTLDIRQIKENSRDGIKFFGSFKGVKANSTYISENGSAEKIKVAFGEEFNKIFTRLYKEQNGKK